VTQTRQGARLVGRPGAAVRAEIPGDDAVTRCERRHLRAPGVGRGGKTVRQHDRLGTATDDLDVQSPPPAIDHRHVSPVRARRHSAVNAVSTKSRLVSSHTNAFTALTARSYTETTT